MLQFFPNLILEKYIFIYFKCHHTHKIRVKNGDMTKVHRRAGLTLFWTTKEGKLNQIYEKERRGDERSDKGGSTWSAAYLPQLNPDFINGLQPANSGGWKG